MSVATKNTKPFYNTEIPSDWEVKRFEDVVDIDKESLNGNTPKDYEFDYISLSDVDSDDFKIETTKQVFASAPSRARRIVKQGDILMSTVRPNLKGFSLIRNEVKDLIASTGFAVITAKQCSNEYLFQYLFNSGIERQFYKLLVGSNYPAINSLDVRKLKIPLPPLPEQKAIARVLSTADAAIHTTEKLIAQKELRKKWLMQQLLTGKKRLKGFRGEWKEVKLGSIGKFSKGKGILKEQVIDSGLPCIRYGEIYTTHNFVIKEFKSFITEEAAAESQRIKKGDILFAGSGETLEEIGKSVAFVGNEIAYAGGDIIILSTNEKVDAECLSYILECDYVRRQKRKHGQGHSVVHIYPSDLAELKITCPSREEQTAIAQVLQAADKEISLLKAKAEKLREQKKWLMQVLLTGKVRLKID